MNCWGVIPAAGIGSRLGAAVPKQYLEIAGRTLLEHSLRALFADARVKGVAVALRAGDERAAALACLQDPRVLRVEGGAERADSVAAGLAALGERAAEDDWVLVHDAARPCLDAKSLGALIDAVAAGGSGAILAQPVSDTVKRSDDGNTVAATVDRRSLWLAQTPQLFRLGELTRALAGAGAVTDEASAMEAAGHPVGLVPGPRTNFKVTTADDLLLARCLLAAGENS
ncbi:2-C-methyl-D-erythritol 4-phosphate cytidylyltransferase [Pseudohaliea rubra]|uniref:2-C-methyl-D-erythritol 4-phosphate cytidylyltransferase n=1 Tax=Pseudohaliea rubra DSM 19751 TaxID=1265313 RepID=A0A095VUB5_9GAMM|nr:2-C-methyl-D-erythritol 4-phosphate cytidylyltransferase [Pseudohaliea rubra]KGE05037.1 2-C-methyl-D-erythritol 4-phosphate cytidylyltransferase [Pseudohaliea rubra DSM 19751]